MFSVSHSKHRLLSTITYTTWCTLFLQLVIQFHTSTVDTFKTCYTDAKRNTSSNPVIKCQLSFPKNIISIKTQILMTSFKLVSIIWTTIKYHHLTIINTHLRQYLKCIDVKIHTTARNMKVQFKLISLYTIAPSLQLPNSNTQTHIYCLSFQDISNSCSAILLHHVSWNSKQSHHPSKKREFYTW